MACHILESRPTLLLNSSASSTFWVEIAGNNLFLINWRASKYAALPSLENSSKLWFTSHIWVFCSHLPGLWLISKRTSIPFCVSCFSWPCPWPKELFLLQLYSQVNPCFFYFKKGESVLQEMWFSLKIYCFYKEKVCCYLSLITYACLLRFFFWFLSFL